MNAGSSAAHAVQTIVVTRRQLLLTLAGVVATVACSPAVPGAQAPTPASPLTTGSVAPAVGASSAPAAGGGAPRSIQVTFASKSAIYAPHLIALEKGYYAAEAIDMTIVDAGGGVATPALLSGTVDYSTSAASALSAILKGAPLKVVYTNTDRPEGYQIWSSTPDVHTLADLQGKSIGIQTRGDTMELATRMTLSAAGIDPGSISFTPLGEGAARLAAIRSGSLPAAVLGAADITQLQDSNALGNMVADMSQLHMLYTGLVAPNAAVEQTRDLTMSFLRGTCKGREYYKAFRDESIQILGKYNGAPDNANTFDYDNVLPNLTPDGSMPVDVQQSDAAARAEVLNITSYPPVQQMYDYSLVQQVYRELQTSGWTPAR